MVAGSSDAHLGNNQRGEHCPERQAQIKPRGQFKGEQRRSGNAEEEPQSCVVAAKPGAQLYPQLRDTRHGGLGIPGRTLHGNSSQRHRFAFARSRRGRRSPAHASLSELFSAKPIDFRAASRAEIVQRVDCSALEHFAQLEEALVRRQIGIDDLSYDLFSTFEDLRRG